MIPIRFGLVGMGRRGRFGWIQALKLLPDVQIVSVSDPIEPLRDEGAAHAGIGREHAYPDVTELLARSDVDAVAVVVAPHQNAGVVIQCLEAGKHVICEVPLALQLGDCWRIVQAVEQSGRVFAMAEQASYTPFVEAWRTLRRDGLLGKITYAEAQYIHGRTRERYWFDARNGQPLTWEQAEGNPKARKARAWHMNHPIWYNPHSLGPLLRILDERVVRVTCMSTRRPSYHDERIPQPDIEVALMQTDGDTIIRIACGAVAPSAEPQHWYHLLGTKGEVETARRGTAGDAMGGSGSLLWLADHYMRSRVEVDWSRTPYQPGPAQAAASGHGGLDLYPIHDFVESIRTGRPPTVDVYRAAEIAAAGIIAGRSAEQGAVPLDVPDVRPGAERQSLTKLEEE